MIFWDDPCKWNVTRGPRRTRTAMTVSQITWARPKLIFQICSLCGLVWFWFGVRTWREKPRRVSLRQCGGWQWLTHRISREGDSRFCLFYNHTDYIAWCDQTSCGWWVYSWGKRIKSSKKNFIFHFSHQVGRLVSIRWRNYLDICLLHTGTKKNIKWNLRQHYVSWSLSTTACKKMTLISICTENSSISSPFFFKFSF